MLRILLSRGENRRARFFRRTTIEFVVETSRPLVK